MEVREGEIMNEWDLLNKISPLINMGDYMNLHKVLLEHEEHITPLIIDSLTMLPVEVDIISEHSSLYVYFLEAAEKHLETLDMRGAIRLQMISDYLKEIKSKYEII